jgi:elongation factor G
MCGAPDQAVALPPGTDLSKETVLTGRVVAGDEPVGGAFVRLLDGSFHPVDSDALSFEICARVAFRNALRKCGPVLMEPIMSLEVVTPEDYMGDVVGDLNRRRGQIVDMDSKGNARIVKAKVPLAEQFGYVTVLRTLTSGRATSTMEFSHYAEVPANLAKEIIDKHGGPRRYADDEE